MAGSVSNSKGVIYILDESMTCLVSLFVRNSAEPDVLGRVIARILAGEFASINNNEVYELTRGERMYTNVALNHTGGMACLGLTLLKHLKMSYGNIFLEHTPSWMTTSLPDPILRRAEYNQVAQDIHRYTKSLGGSYDYILFPVVPRSDVFMHATEMVHGSDNHEGVTLHLGRVDAFIPSMEQAAREASGVATPVSLGELAMAGDIEEIAQII